MNQEPPFRTLRAIDPVGNEAVEGHRVFGNVLGIAQFGAAEFLQEG